MVIFKYVMCVKGWNVEIIDNDESFDRVAGETRSEVIVGTLGNAVLVSVSE